MKLLVLFLVALLSITSFGQIDDSLGLNQELEEVVISIDQEQSEFYSKKGHYILDIIDDSSGIIVLLKNRGKYFVEQVLWNGELQITQELDFKSSKLTKDCLNNLYFIQAEGYQRFSVNSGALSLGEFFKTSSYQSSIEPCVASSKLKLLFKRLENHNQSTLLWTFDYANDSSQTVYWYEDPTVVKANNDQAQLIKEENYTNHARMKEISIAELKVLQDQLERATFFESTITQAPYSPVMSFTKKHYFFNLKNDSIYRFDENFILTHEAKLPLKKEHSKGLRIMQDKARGVLFFYSKTTPLTIINVEKGKIGRSIPSAGINSPSKFIHNGSLYFLAKSSVEDAHNKLFRQKL